MGSAEKAVVLVTGASGYVATHVVQQLQQQGYQVRGTVRSLANEDKVKPLRNLCPDADYPLELVEGDLTSDAGWVEAVKGCTYVMHTASPFVMQNPKDEQEILRPAVEGTLRVLRACQAAGGVRRVVLTSSCVSIFGKGNNPTGELFTEADWTDVDDAPSTYAKSKTMAERAAWDFMEKLPKEGERFELAVINPSLVMGPPLCGTAGTSMQILKGLMTGPKVMNHGTIVVDVRDVAKAHVVAMTAPAATGKRHITSCRRMTFPEMAQVLSAEFAPQGYPVPTEVDGEFRGVMQDLDNSRLRTVLGVDPLIPAETSLVDMAYSMIEAGLIHKADGYTGPPAK